MSAPSAPTKDSPLTLKLLTDDQERSLAVIFAMLDPALGPTFERSKLRSEVGKLHEELDGVQYNLFRPWVGPMEGQEYDTMKAKQKALQIIQELLSKIYQSCWFVKRNQMTLAQVREQGKDSKKKVNEIQGRYWALLEIFYDPVPENPSSFNLTSTSTRDDSILSVRTGNSSRGRSFSF